MTAPTAPAATAQERSVPVEAILGRYQNELATKTQQLFVAQAAQEAAEAECAQLRLRIVELEQPADDAAPRPARTRR